MSIIKGHTVHKLSLCLCVCLCVYIHVCACVHACMCYVLTAYYSCTYMQGVQICTQRMISALSYHLLDLAHQEQCLTVQVTVCPVNSSN